MPSSNAPGKEEKKASLIAGDQVHVNMGSAITAAAFTSIAGEPVAEPFTLMFEQGKASLERALMKKLITDSLRDSSVGVMWAAPSLWRPGWRGGVGCTHSRMLVLCTSTDCDLDVVWLKTLRKYVSVRDTHCA